MTKTEQKCEKCGRDGASWRSEEDPILTNTGPPKGRYLCEPCFKKANSDVGCITIAVAVIVLYLLVYAFFAKHPPDYSPYEHDDSQRVYTPKGDW